MTAYYNENDPKAAAWLRELVAADLIAPGEVDERSIEDVTPADIAGYRQHHFFAGIGGWSLGLRLAGWPDDRPAWTGSCPCQPFSQAGAGKGTDDPRHLWPVWRWLVDQCRPAIVFGEQVASPAGRRWLAGVRTDLEAMGYGVGAADLCAAGVGAPHIRQRLWWVADAKDAHGRRRKQGKKTGTRTENVGRRRSGVGGSDSGLADAGREQSRQRRVAGGEKGARHEPRHGSGVGSSDGGLGHTLCEPRERGTGSVSRAQTQSGSEGRADGHLADRPEHAGEGGGMGDALESGLERHARHEPDGDESGWLDAEENRPVAQASGDCWRNAVWIPCADGKARRIEPGLEPLVDGLRGRVGLLRGYGNAIVPQVAATFVHAVLTLTGERNA